MRKKKVFIAKRRQLLEMDRLISISGARKTHLLHSHRIGDENYKINRSIFFLHKWYIFIDVSAVHTERKQKLDEFKCSLMDILCSLELNTATQCARN